MNSLPDISEIPQSIHEINKEDRPRERLLAGGPARLSDFEILAALIGTGRPGHSCLLVAHRALSAFGGVSGLAQPTAESLQNVVGIGEVLAARLVAAFELARRAERGIE